MMLSHNGKRLSYVQDSLAVRAGDTLQLGIYAPQKMYYAVFYRDDGGKVKLYMQSNKETLGNLQGETLPHSLIIEPGWKHECLYCAMSKKPINKSEAITSILTNNLDVKTSEILFNTYHLTLVP
jgi:hypothetical protein